MAGEWDPPVPPRRDGGGHFPGVTLLDAYGNGGFRFADMSHRGSILCLPSGVWEWPVSQAGEIDIASLEKVIAEKSLIELLIVGTGVDLVPLRHPVRDALRQAGVSVDVMATGPAARTYNVLRADERRVAAALIAVE